MSEIYNSFSSVYDKLIDDVDYNALYKYFISVCKAHSHKPNLVLDAACGTGNFTKVLIDNNLDVIGVDNSSEMLSIASEKLGGKCALICQDLCELDLYGTIDTVFCTLDALNHITDYERFKLALKKMALFLEPGGLMFFDVNTIYKHQKILANNIFTDEKENIYLVWQNSLYDENTVNINMDFFVKQDDGKYIRMCENFDERAYSFEQIDSALNEARLKTVEIKDFFTFENVTDKSEKVVYAVKKEKFDE